MCFSVCESVNVWMDVHGDQRCQIPENWSSDSCEAPMEELETELGPSARIVHAAGLSLRGELSIRTDGFRKTLSRVRQRVEVLSCGPLTSLRPQHHSSITAPAPSASPVPVRHVAS